MLIFHKSKLHTARGQFSDSWVAIYKLATGDFFYGYGRTEAEAIQDLQDNIRDNGPMGYQVVLNAIRLKI